MAERLMNRYYLKDENGKEEVAYIGQDGRGYFASPHTSETEIFNKLGELEDLMEEFNISCIDELHERLCWVVEQKKELDKIYNLLGEYGLKSIDSLQHFLQDDIQKLKLFWIKDYSDTTIEEFHRVFNDRDVWRKACKLACNELGEVLGSCPKDCGTWGRDDAWCEENCGNEEAKLLCWDKYFYQMAQKKLSKKKGGRK